MVWEPASIAGIGLLFYAKRGCGDTLPRGEGDPQGRERNGEMVDVLSSMWNGICARFPLPSASLTPSPRGKGWGARG